MEGESKKKDVALMDASSEGEAEKMCQLLREEDVDAKDEDGNTILMYVASEGRLDAKSLLFRKGICLSKLSLYSRLREIDSIKYTEVLDQLLEAGADINIQNKMGKTAFDVATNEDIKNRLREAQKVQEVGAVGAAAAAPDAAPAVPPSVKVERSLAAASSPATTRSFL